MSDLDWIPECLSFFIEKDPHELNYGTVYDYCKYVDNDWVSEFEKDEAIKTGKLFVMQIYPSTPIGFVRYAASSLEALKAHSDRIKQEVK